MCAVGLLQLGRLLLRPESQLVLSNFVRQEGRWTRLCAQARRGLQTANFAV